MDKNSCIKYDILIVGLGYIGMILVHILQKLGFSIGVIAKKHHGANRLLSIAIQSFEILKQHDLALLLPDIGQKINQIRVVDNYSLAKLDFMPQMIKKDIFGYMINENDFSNLLKDHLQVDIYYQNITDIKIDQYHTYIILDDNRILKSQLIIGADGKNSIVRQKIFPRPKVINYNQTAITTEIEHNNAHNGVAVERFTPQGPFAILPQSNQHKSSIVWTVKGNIKNFDIIDEYTIHELIAEKLDSYLGNFKVLYKPSLFTLEGFISKTIYKNRVVLVGDAAHVIHPVAGQGLNLGIRDVDVLVNMITKRIKLGLDHGILDSYPDKRYTDIQMMLGSTDLIVRLFSNNNLLLKIIRRLGLKILDRSILLKILLMNYATGSLHSTL